MTKLSTISYQNLLNSVSFEIKIGIAKARKMLEHARLKTYWNVGEHIDEYGKFLEEHLSDEEKNKLQPANHLFRPLTESFYQDFSVELMKKNGIDMGVAALKESVQFYRNYSKLPKKSLLTFTHYRVLMSVQDEAKRLQFEKKAIEQGLTTDELRRQVVCFNAVRKTKVKISGGKLVYQRGRPYLYRIFKASDVAGPDQYEIDCGFEISVAIPEGTKAKPRRGRMVRSVKEHKEYSIVIDEKGRSDLYTYGATVEKVVDGDTVDVRIHVGFGIKMRCQRLRFRGINAPEMKKEGGPAAKKFLLDYLSQCPKIVVRTTKPSGKVDGGAKGMFGRWLVDVFALPGCDDTARIAKEGVYLNQFLVDKGFAGIYRK